ncbi:hypothetical protein PT197_01500 [Erysipelothrix rhusiopathiae]|nr:hypothetical protein [Erysipelothrix rhusiopathiae]
MYKAEREEYLILYNSISKFELLFITQLTFHFMKKYSVTNQKSALIGFDQLLNRVDTTVIRSTGDTESIAHRREKMKGHLEKCKRTLQGSTRKDGTTNHPTDIYLMFDRLYLTEMLTIYMCLKGLERKKIYEQMKKRGLNLGAEDHNDFDTKIFNLVAIRNCVMHFNSLEIVMKYSNYKTKEIRGTSSRADYASIIRSLRYIDKLDEHFIV